MFALSKLLTRSAKDLQLCFCYFSRRCKTIHLTHHGPSKSSFDTVFHHRVQIRQVRVTWCLSFLPREEFSYGRLLFPQICRSFRAKHYIRYYLAFSHLQALWLSGYSDRLEIYFLREQEFESLRRREIILHDREGVDMLLLW
jgi:hypothetical protein